MEVYGQGGLEYDDENLDADDGEVGEGPVLHDALDEGAPLALVRVKVSPLLPAVVVLVVEGGQKQVGHRQEAPDPVHVGPELGEISKFRSAAFICNILFTS